MSDHSEIAAGHIRSVMEIVGRPPGKYVPVRKIAQLVEDLPDGPERRRARSELEAAYQAWWALAITAKSTAASVVRRVRTMHPNEAMQEAMLGLFAAAQRFDPRRGFTFATYARWWARSMVFRYQHESESVLTMPRQSLQLSFMASKLGSEAEAADACSISRPTATAMLSAVRGQVSLDHRATHDDGDGISLHDTLGHDPTAGIEDRIYVDALLERVKPADREVLQMVRAGLVQTEIAAVLGVTMQAVSRRIARIRITLAADDSPDIGAEPVGLQIIRAVWDAPGARRAEIARSVGCLAWQAQDAIDVLVEGGQILKRVSADGSRYYPADVGGPVGTAKVAHVVAAVRSGLSRDDGVAAVLGIARNKARELLRRGVSLGMLTEKRGFYSMKEAS